MQDYIKKLQKAYNDGSPLISNEEYDAIISMYPTLEQQIGPEGEVKHAFRMYSLDKKYPCRGDKLPHDLSPYVKTPKLDGCAVSLLYVLGDFKLGLTRGDGFKGLDKTKHMKNLVPKKFVNNEHNIVQITGEVVVTRPVKNKRNFASGALNTKNTEEFEEKTSEGGLTFVAYGISVYDSSTGVCLRFEDDMSMLEYSGFSTVLSKDVLALCESGNIPTDGEVYRLNSNELFQSTGFTHKFPKGAFAVKVDDEGKWTTLRSIEWQVGGSGKVTPVAVFDEIKLDDANTTRATLNNVDYMKMMGITHIGQKLRVIRAGGIIPKVVEADLWDE